MTDSSSWMERVLAEVAELSDMDLTSYPTQLQTEEQLKEKLSEIIAWLIDHDFERLLWILYRIDVNENKAKKLLAEHAPDDAPNVLAGLIIQRQLLKEEMRKHFKNADVLDADDPLRL